MNKTERPLNLFTRLFGKRYDDASRPETAIRVETLSSISTRVVEYGDGYSVVEMRSKLLPLIRQGVGLFLDGDYPLYRMPDAVIRSVLRLRKERWQCVHRSEKSLEEAEMDP